MLCAIPVAFHMEEVLINKMMCAESHRSSRGNQAKGIVGVEDRCSTCS